MCMLWTQLRSWNVLRMYKDGVLCGWGGSELFMYGFTQEIQTLAMTPPLLIIIQNPQNIYKSFFSSKLDCSAMHKTRVRNSGLLKECWTLGHLYAAGFSTKHYLPDKLRWSAFISSITMLVFKKQLFWFTIGSFTRLPSLNKGSYKKSVSARL